MAINKKLIHFKNFSDFNSKKLSANENNTQYTLGITGTVTNGSPDILYQSICYIKDTKQQWTHGQLYECSSNSANVAAALNNKVDKESGKGLSEEDFTSALKAKLEGLSNYNDTEISNAVSSLQTQLNTLVSGDANDAINSFNEIIAFLDGVKDTQDLASIIASIEQQIAAKMDKVTLATVATSGSYNDLSNKPTIPAEQVNADWNATSGKAQILNKPTIPSAVTETTVSGWGFTMNTGTVTGVKVNGTTKSPTSGTVDIGNVVTSVKINGSTKSPSNGVVDLGTVITSHQDISGKQDKLVSGTNIKTINGNSVLGSGEITITPNISNNVTYSGTLTSDQVAIFDGTTGKVKASGYTIAKSVPANALFTDTTYSTVGTNGTTGLIKNGSSVTSTSGLTACPIINGVPYYKAPSTTTDNDTKNTAGTTNNTGRKMYLVGATSQAANPQTYSNSNCYIGTDNCLYSGGNKVLTSFTESYKGTVTKISTGTGLTGGDITSSGTISLNSTYQTYCTNGNSAYSYTSWADGMNTATSISNVKIDKRMCKCTITSSGSFSLQSTPAAGKDIHVIVYNNGSSEITVSLPTASPYIILGSDALSIPSKKYAEINALSDGTNVYLRCAEQ